MSVIQTDGQEGNDASAEIFVTKLAAARRQISAAIRMFFDREDELAIHTVASAAYGILKDIKADRGRDEAADYHLTAIFYLVRDFRRDTLPRHFTDDPETMQWIRDIAEQIPITANSEFRDIAASVSRETARGYWIKRNKIANFLKHADKDAQSHISMDDVDNTELLMIVLGAYVDLSNDAIWPEGHFLLAYVKSASEDDGETPESVLYIVTKLREIDPELRLDFLSQMTKEMVNH